MIAGIASDSASIQSTVALSSVPDAPIIWSVMNGSVSHKTKWIYKVTDKYISILLLFHWFSDVLLSPHYPKILPGNLSISYPTK